MKRIIVFALALVSVFSVSAKTEKFGTWIELEFTKEFLKKFEFSIIPDFRLQDDFTLDKYQFDAKLAYEPFQFFEVAAAYRIKTNVKSKKNEVTHRLVLDATAKTDVGKFTPSFRTRFVTYNDVDGERVNVIRPRVKVAYDIKGNKFTPYTRYEMYYDLVNNKLYRGRFDIGFTRKMGKLHRIGIYYRLQHFTEDDQNSFSIIGIDYRLKI
ncbi:DUF2490 domain-containing protein [Prolixibacteraceae bacterium Z1-6]|uniref:DUF2490 domain-containing protein n=1 Tax=Draconibacterium aestuarii TaxID=2998507 RepID=A0A9X3J7Y9_9BACT|nr:DUF2490 domain-containing protein [Prolixibacteraceae bacterium Z1-6]